MMANFLCDCGKRLSTTQYSEILLEVYLKEEFETIKKMGKLDIVMIPASKYDIWKCPVCGRIHVFGKDNLRKKRFEICKGKKSLDSIWSDDYLFEEFQNENIELLTIEDKLTTSKIKSEMCLGDIPLHI